MQDSYHPKQEFDSHLGLLAAIWDFLKILQASRNQNFILRSFPEVKSKREKNWPASHPRKPPGPKVCVGWVVEHTKNLDHMFTCVSIDAD